MTMILRTFAFLILTALPGLASEPRVIDWSMLAPSAEAIENPFDELTGEQMDMLRLVLRFEMQNDPEADDTKRQEVAALRTRLEANGIDVDGLFEARLEIIAKREAAASAVNDDIVGANVRMPGFLLPLAYEDRRAIEFLLLPTFGACIHTPPPAPNQIVHVVYPDGIEVSGLFTPVWIAGMMTAERSVQDVMYSDGDGVVSVSYGMEADAVERYENTAVGRYGSRETIEWRGRTLTPGE